MCSRVYMSERQRSMETKDPGPQGVAARTPSFRVALLGKDRPLPAKGAKESERFGGNPLLF